jgi:hypothetical protein
LATIQQRIGQWKKSSHGIGQHYEITVVADETGTKAATITWTKNPVSGSMLTDLEAVFRSLKSELGLRPLFHQQEDRTEGHLFITVLAYQMGQTIRRKLAAQGDHLSGNGLREILAVQQRVTATFRQRDGRTQHVRKATVAEPALRRIYDALAIDPARGALKNTPSDPPRYADVVPLGRRDGCKCLIMQGRVYSGMC